jgi:hypothetical protein
MSDEILEIGLISGIFCRDGRHFQELICSDENGKDVRIMLPTSRVCGESIDCEDCEEDETCELQDFYETDIGRKLIIKRVE